MRHHPGDLRGEGAGEDATACVWDRNGNPVGVFSGRRAAKYVWNLRFLEGEFHPPRLLTVAADGVLRIWELWDPALPSFLGGEGAVYSIAISPSGDVIAAGAQDGAIRLWDREGHLLNELPTRHLDSLAELGNALRRRDRLDEAERLLRRVVARDPLRLRARSPLARILLARGDVAGARALMRASCELEPQEPVAWYGLAWVHVVPGVPPELWNPAEALELARRAVELTGGQKPAYLTLLGIVHYRLEQFAQADQALRRSEAIQLRRDGQCAPMTITFLAMVRHCLGHQEEALLLLEQVQASLSNPAAAADDARGALQEARALIDGAAPLR